MPFNYAENTKTPTSTLGFEALLWAVTDKRRGHSLDESRRDELLEIVSSHGFGQGARESKNVPGRVHEYFLAPFASAEGKGRGQLGVPRKGCCGTRNSPLTNRSKK